MNYVLMEVVLGYRDNHRGPWQRMAQGNITRTLRCHMTEWVSSRCNSLAEQNFACPSQNIVLVNLIFFQLSHMLPY